MADKNNKVSSSITGPYYVDNNCIDCDACAATAPENFDRNAAEGHAFVKKQPETDSEREKCVEAMQSCPVEAIGDDG